MRESEKVCHLFYLAWCILILVSQKTANGVVWYIIGVIWVLSLYPIDIAVVSILMCVSDFFWYVYTAYIVVLPFQLIVG